MRASAQARSLRLPSAQASRRSKAFRWTCGRLPRASTGANVRASASAPSARRRRARRRSRRRNSASSALPAALPGAMARPADLRPDLDRHARRERDCGLRLAARTSPKRRPPNSAGASCSARCRPWSRATSRPSVIRSAPCRRAWAPISRRCRAAPMSARGRANGADRLTRKGVSGLGQSSWGPTGFAFAASEAEGQSLARGSPRPGRRLEPAFRARARAQQPGDHRDELRGIRTRYRACETLCHLPPYAKGGFAAYRPAKSAGQTETLRQWRTHASCT